MQIAAQNIVQHREILRKLFVCLFVCYVMLYYMRLLLPSWDGKREKVRFIWRAGRTSTEWILFFPSSRTNERKIIWLQQRAAMQLIKSATKIQRKYKQLSTVLHLSWYSYYYHFKSSSHFSFLLMPFNSFVLRTFTLISSVCTRTMTCWILYPLFLFFFLLYSVGLLVPFVYLGNPF